MKFNIADPRTGAQKNFEVDDDKKCACFFDKKMGTDVDISSLGDEYKGYIMKIMGGNDKQGFPMKQGILIKGRTRLLLDKSHSTYDPKRKGERRRKSVRGCIVGQDIRALSLALVKQGDTPVEGFSDRSLPRRVGPKRVTRIRRLFALEETRKDDKNGALVKKNVIRRTWTAPNGKARQKAPKIQRLSTPERRRNRRLMKLAKKACWKNGIKASNEYQQLLAKVSKDKAEKKRQSKSSKGSLEEKAKKVEKVQEKKKVDPKAAKTTGATKTATKTADTKKSAPAKDTKKPTKAQEEFKKQQAVDKKNLNKMKKNADDIFNV